MLKSLQILAFLFFFPSTTLVWGQPTNLAELGLWPGYSDTNNKAYDVRVVNKIAYVANDTAGLEIIDVGIPTNPKRIGHVDIPGRSLGVDVINRHAFVATGSNGVAVVNVADPTHPVRVANYDTGNFSEGIQVVSNTVFVAAFNRFSILNASDPTNLVLVGSCPVGSYGLRIVGNTAYLAASGVSIIDFSNPSNPVKVGQVSFSCNRMDYKAPYLYVTSFNGLVVFDASNPTNLVQVGVSGGSFGRWFEDIKIIGEYAYATTQPGGAVVFDISNRTNPVPIFTYRSKGGGYELDEDGEFLYLVDKNWGLAVLGPSAVLKGAYQPTQKAFGITLTGTPNLNYTIQTSFDLASWSSLITLKLPDTGVISFADPQSANFARRFYRTKLER